MRSYYRLDLVAGQPRHDQPVRDVVAEQVRSAGRRRGAPDRALARPAAALETDLENGAARWRWGTPAQEEKAAALEMFDAGGKVADVQEALRVSRATAYRWQ